MKISWLFFSSYLLMSCGNDSHLISKYFVRQVNDSILKVAQKETIPNYRFEPITSTLNGNIKVELFYGLPNYGELPDTDAKEYSYILYPENIFNVIQTSDSNDFNLTTIRVDKFQLVPSGQLSLDSFLDRRVKVTGKFFGKHTGHHHTDILMTVSQIELP